MTIDLTTTDDLAPLARGTAVRLPDGTTGTVVTSGIGGRHHIDVHGTILRDWPREQLTVVRRSNPLRRVGDDPMPIDGPVRFRRTFADRRA